VALANQWFSQPTKADHSVHPTFTDMRYPHPASSPRNSGNFSMPLHNAFEQMQIQPSKDDFHRGNLRGMPVEDEQAAFQVQARMPAPVPNPGPPSQAMLPPPFSQMPGPYNGYPPAEYGTYFMMPPPEPFTDYSFAYSHLGPPQFPMSHPNGSNQPNIMYPNPLLPMQPNGMPMPDARQLMPQMPYDFSIQQPQPFFYGSPQMLSQMPVPSGVQMGPLNPAHMANNFARQVREVGFLLPSN